MPSHLAPTGDSVNRHMPRFGQMGRAVRALLGAAVFLVGAMMFLYPSAAGYVSQQEANAVIEEASTQSKASPEANTAAYEYLRAYNERVRTGELTVNDPWGIGSNVEELSSVGLSDGVIGSLTVPSMGVRLPIYLGATHTNLERGAALVAGTSAPLGETSSNVVLAGHRGYLTNGLFRNIEDVQAGDLLKIETPWDSLVYRAVDIQVVAPDDVGSVAVQEGRDLVTLLTCHPYGTTLKRYLVVFERTTDPEDVAAFSDDNSPNVVEEIVNPIEEALRPSESPALVVERWARVAGLAVMVAIPAGVLLGVLRHRLQRRHR